MARRYPRRVVFLFGSFPEIEIPVAVDALFLVLKAHAFAKVTQVFDVEHPVCLEVIRVVPVVYL